MEPDASCVARDETLSAYVDGELGQRERMHVDAHIDGCARCRQEVARFGQVAALVRQAGEAEIAGFSDETLWPGISKEITPAGGPGLVQAWQNRAPSWARPVWVPVAIAAALVITLVLPFIQNGEGLQAADAVVESIDEGDVMVLREGKDTVIIWVFDD